MEANRAAENLQTIRTLMERSALYRRALAPIMIWCGGAGIVGGIAGWQRQIASARGFVLFWAGVAAAALIGSFILVRRQALKDSEPFWSPPARRVVQALTPAFTVGAFISAVIAGWVSDVFPQEIAIIIWCWAFGCGIHAAGFFMPRGIKWFGWLFVLIGCGLAACLLGEIDSLRLFGSPHLLMGGIFGGLHLAYGVYLYVTESRKTEA